MFEMTPLCGFGMSEGGGVAEPAPRHLQNAVANEGATIVLDDTGNDGMLIMWPASDLNMITLVLPSSGPNLQMLGITSMSDIASIVFTGGEILNPPMELLANQAVLIQRIDKALNRWITIL